MLSIVLTGFLVRADGWGGSNFFNVWVCSALFALLSAFHAPLLTALACGGAFLVWRAPAFHGWESWPNMYWRGWWTSAIGFTALSYVVHGVPYYGLLSVPFAAIYMTIYASGYKWLPQTVLGFDRHVLIEQASGWYFGAFILIILKVSL